MYIYTLYTKLIERLKPRKKIENPEKKILTVLQITLILLNIP